MTDRDSDWLDNVALAACWLLSAVLISMLMFVAIRAWPF
jgi:hypothetical protein